MWRAHEDNFTGNAIDIYPWYDLENYSFKITTKSHKDPISYVCTLAYIVLQVLNKRAGPAKYKESFQVLEFPL